MPPTATFTGSPTGSSSNSVEPEDTEVLCAIVVGDMFVSTHALPAAGTVTIGRAPECDICIDTPSISRRHAVLHVGEQVVLEDAGSSNGTTLDGVAVPRGTTVLVPHGGRIGLPSVAIVLQRSRTTARPRRIWLHDYFEARLEEECLRAGRVDHRFSLVRVRAVCNDIDERFLQELVVSSVRASDVIARCGTNDYEVLLTDATPAEANCVLERIARAMRDGGKPLQIGVAHYPADGRVPEALMTKASADLIADGAADERRSEFVVAAPKMQELHDLVSRVAAGEINTLVLGETGVGKEIIAERLHELSPRVKGPLLRLNCAAFTETLLESELFGHEQGAFTGATAAKPGLLEAASGGTVFLDEIGDMPPSTQAMLLRCLEDGTVRRVGGLKNRSIDIRIVAATHKDLEAEVRSGNFRRDLFFRIAGVTLTVPPLRERVEEIGPLAASFVREACNRQRRPRPVQLSAGALSRLERYDWPGNIRELRNAMDRAVLLANDDAIRPEHLPPNMLARAERLGVDTAAIERIDERELEPAGLDDSGDSHGGLRAGVKAQEKRLIRDALERAAGNQTKAAKLLGISRRTLIARIEEFGLPRPRKKTA